MATAIPEIYFFHCAQCFGRFPASTFKNRDSIECPHCGTKIEAPAETRTAFRWTPDSSGPFARLERVVIPRATRKAPPTPKRAMSPDVGKSAVSLIVNAFKQLPAEKRHEILGLEPPKTAKAKLNQSGEVSMVEVVSQDDRWDDIDWPKPAKAKVKSPQHFFQGQMIRAASCGLLLVVGALLMSHLHALLTEGPMVKPPPIRNEPVTTAPTADQLINTFTKFLKSPTIEGKNGFVRDPARVLPLMRNYYASHPITPVWLSEEASIHGEYTVRQRKIEATEVYELIIQPDPNLTISAPFVSKDDKLVLDWEAFTGYGQMSVREFFEQEPEVPTLLRATLRFETASGTPAHYKRVRLGDLDGWSAPAYLPADRLRFHEVLDLENSVRDMNQVEGAESYAALTMRLAVQVRFRDLVGLSEPVAVIESLVRPNWFAP